MALTQVQGGMILASGQSIPKAALPTGSVLQVLGFQQTLNFTTTSTSYTDIGITGVTITPSSSSSKVLLIARIPTYSVRYGYSIQIKRNGTSIYTAGALYEIYLDPGSNTNYRNNWTVNIIDSPATTSACTYTFFMASSQASFTQGVGESNFTSFFTLMEISA